MKHLTKTLTTTLALAAAALALTSSLSTAHAQEVAPSDYGTAQSVTSASVDWGPEQEAMPVSYDTIWGGSPESMAYQQTLSTSTTFTDISGHWGEQHIYDAADYGLVSGYPNGTFKPDETISIAEFLVLITKAYPAFQEQAEAMTDSTIPVPDAWYGKYSYVATANGFYVNRISIQNIETPITRQEAAYIINEAIKVTKTEDFIKSYPEQNVRDYSDIFAGYKEPVLNLYSLGIVSGQHPDANGMTAYNPTGNLTRAETCVMFLNLVHADRRVDVDFSTKADYSDLETTPEGNQVIPYNTSTSRPMAQAGDKATDKDGNEVVLVVGPSGVLGEGQGVAPDLGAVSPSGSTVIEDGNYTNRDDYTDSLGNNLTNKKYWLNHLTGEGHWSSEWGNMVSSPTTDGTYHWQLSDDQNYFWSASGMWSAVYSRDASWSGYDTLREMHGLS